MAELVERVGYDAVRLGSLSAGRVLEPGGPVFGALLRRPEFERAVRSGAADASSASPPARQREGAPP